MTTNSKIMVYDDNCPLCNAYTSAFVKMGLLNVEGRQAFSQVDAAIMCQFDKQKSRNEIPLLDTATNQTWYGLDAMLEVLNIKFPLVKKLANIVPIKWFLLRLYKLISYNRKVIVAIPKNSTAFDCTPDFNKKYRLLFLLLATIVGYVFINSAYQFFNVKAFANISVTQVYIGFASFCLISWLVPLFINKSMAYHYWGQIAILVLLSVLLLSPLLLIGKIILLKALVKSLYALCVFAFLVKEIRRRKVYLMSIIAFSKRPLAQLK